MASLNILKSCLKMCSPKSGPLIYQFRTTYILKRRNSIQLSKFEDKGCKRLKSKHYIYDLLEDTNTKKFANVDVLLTTYVEGLGECGDIVTVKPYYARNGLLLPRLAVYPSPENKKAYAKEIEARKLKEVQTYSSPFASVMIKILSKRCIAVDVSATEPWVLEPWHIRVALRNSNIVAPEYAIEIPDKSITGPDMDKDDKEFVVYVTVNHTEKVPVRCRLHHEGIERNKLWYLEERDAMFPEQKQLLTEMLRPDTLKLQKRDEKM